VSLEDPRPSSDPLPPDPAACGRASLRGQVVIVTGAGRGIGKAIAQASAEAGATVLLAARSAEELEKAAAEIRAKGKAAVAVPTDLVDKAASENLIKTAVDRFGRLDVLVNNAGTNHIANLVMTKEEDFRAVYELNVFAVFRLTKAALRPMIRAKSGRIINVSSVSAKVGAAYNSAYASSKAAVLGFTRSVAKETAQLGITVNAICPWHVDTELVREAMGKRAKMFGKSSDEYLEEIVGHSPQKRLIDASEVAGLALYLMSPEARGITGQSLNVCGGTVMD
jgi:NAD(P)-dependent dehydrogenase (short-subunit alcohol dehydrogenase family)